MEILGANAQPPPAQCIDDENRVHIRAATLEAIDVAYRDQVQHLFEVWMRDAKDQPDRAKTGVQNAIQAVLRARKDALAWMPPQCP